MHENKYKKKILKKNPKKKENENEISCTCCRCLKIVNYKFKLDSQVHNSLIKVREIYSFKEKIFYLKRGRMII